MKNKSAFFSLLLLMILLRLLVLSFGSDQLSFSESFKAMAAYDLISERNFDFFDYTFRHNDGGSLATVLLAAIMFKLFGVTVFSSNTQ